MSCTNYPHGEDYSQLDPVTAQLLREAFDELCANTDTSKPDPWMHIDGHGMVRDPDELATALGLEPAPQPSYASESVPKHRPSANATHQRPMSERGFKKRKRR